MLNILIIIQNSNLMDKLYYKCRWVPPPLLWVGIHVRVNELINLRDLSRIWILQLLHFICRLQSLNVPRTRNMSSCPDADNNNNRDPRGRRKGWSQQQYGRRWKGGNSLFMVINRHLHINMSCKEYIGRPGTLLTPDSSLSYNLALQFMDLGGSLWNGDCSNKTTELLR